MTYREDGVVMLKRGLLYLCAGLMIGCGTVSEDAPPTQPQQKTNIFDTGGDAVRIGLAELSGELPEVGYQELLNTGAVVEEGETTGTSELSASLRRALLAVVTYRTDRVDDAVVRIQRFTGSIKRFQHCAYSEERFTLCLTLPFE